MRKGPIIVLTSILLAGNLACSRPSASSQTPRKADTVMVRELDADGNLAPASASPAVVRPPEAWKRLLSSEEHRILRTQGTERPFCSRLGEQKTPGVYTCKACGLPLFAQEHKFESGTGWPSFHSPIAPENIVEHEDRSHGMVRTEIVCKRCQSHLGHVFDDGPPPTGRRHCLNSASLSFAPRPAPLPPGQARAVFAGGCFWGVQQLFDEIPGVVSSRVGYTGGRLGAPSYEAICTHLTGHAEALEIVFDTNSVSFRQLVDAFFEIHDPTQLDRQGPDIGDQYRSAVFLQDPTQEAVVKEAIDSLEKAKVFDKPIVTRLEPGTIFWEAEDYHQKYGQRRGIQCHRRRVP
jgi:peptide methionine sulfoxide reductase msrA/msrB